MLGISAYVTTKSYDASSSLREYKTSEVKEKSRYARTRSGYYEIIVENMEGSTIDKQKKIEERTAALENSSTKSK